MISGGESLPQRSLLSKKKKKKELSYSLLFVKLSSESVGILL